MINNKKDENIKIDLNKRNFNFELIAKIELEKKDNIYIKKVIELPKDRLGILYEIKYKNCLFSIYSSKTFVKIYNFDYYFIDAVKTEDNDLILCNEYDLYYYKLINNEYEFIQIFECFEKQKIKYQYYNYYCRSNYNYSINFIYPLKNGDIMACSHSEITLYCKEFGKYIFAKCIDVKYHIEEIIEIKPNMIVLYLTESLGSGCRSTGFNTYIYLYNIQNRENTILSKNESYDIPYYNMNINHFLKINEYLFVKIFDSVNIYDIGQNMKLINESDCEIINEDGYTSKKLKNELPFEDPKIKFDNNFILAINKDGKSFIYKYENKLFKEYKEFPWDLNHAGIMKLKNDKLIIYLKIK